MEGGSVDKAMIIGPFYLCSWRFVFAGRREGFADGAEDAIDEAAGCGTAKAFGDFDGFVDDDLVGNVRLVVEFINGEAQNIAVDGGDLRNGELRGGGLDDGIDFRLVIDDALNEADGASGDRLWDIVDLVFILIGGGGGGFWQDGNFLAPNAGEDFVDFMSGQIPFVKGLHGEDTRLVPRGRHINIGTLAKTRWNGWATTLAAARLSPGFGLWGGGAGLIW